MQLTNAPARAHTRIAWVLILSLAAALALIACGHSGPADAQTSAPHGPSSVATASGGTTSPKATAGFPTRASTGVPAGVTLQPYRGSCTISHTTTITGVDATRCPSILIRAPHVVIQDSLLPVVDATHGGTDSVVLLHSTIRGGHWQDGAIWGARITARHVDVTGGQHSFHCQSHCTLTDSWLHQQWNPAGQSFHNNAFITNGGHNILLRNNRLHCSPRLNSNDGGCTADVSLFGDFEKVYDVTVDHNLLMANDSSISYCAYGGYSSSKPYPVADHIVFTNNVFQRGSNRRCGVYGPVTSFQSKAPGNVWSGNQWDDGKPLRP